MMARADATRVVVELAAGSPIVASIGNPSSDLAAVADRPEYVYIRAMGMASSFGLGLALAQPERRVVILDGDGALLMNLGSLATAAMHRPPNLVHVVWDNGSWEITGGQPVGSAFGVDLAGVARACGFEQVARAETLAGFRDAFGEAMRDARAWVIVADVEPGNSRHSTPIDDTPLATRFQAWARG
jgi:sulfopyruvate decarboxylase subunit beta